MTDEPVGIGKAGLDIFTFQPRITLKDDFSRVAGSQHAEDMFHGQTVPADNGFAAKYLRVHRDPLEKGLFTHGAPQRRMITHVVAEKHLLLGSGKGFVVIIRHLEKQHIR